MPSIKAHFLACTIAALAIIHPVLAQETEKQLRKGLALIKASRPFEAEQALSKIQIKDPGYPSAQVALGHLYLNRAALSQAAAAFSHALETQPGDAQARLGLGIAFSRQGKLEEAVREFSLSVEDPEIGQQARAQMIQCLFYLGKEEEALKEASRQTDLYPSVPEFQTLLGFLYQSRGNNTEAYRAYRRAFDLEPYRLSNCLNLVSICNTLKDWNGSLFLLQKALDIDPNNPPVYLEIASVLEKLGRRDDASAARAEAQRTLDAELLYMQATQARLAGLLLQAQRLLESSVRLNPRLSKAWTDIGDILRRTRHPAEAAGMFRRAIETDPSNRLARLGLAATLQTQGEISDSQPGMKAGFAESEDRWNLQAEATLLAATRDHPDDADLLACLGRIYESGGKNLEALKVYADALKMNPLQEEALVGRGRAQLARGNIQGAMESFRRATELASSDPQAWYGLIQVSRQAKDQAGAESACRACLARAPADNHCREELAHLHLDSGRYREAAEEFRLLLRNGRESKSVIDGLAFVLLKTGHHAESEVLFEKSRRLFGNDTWVYSNLGYLRQSQGDIPGAIVNYRKALALAPADPDKNYSLGFALYLGRDYAKAIEPLRSALQIRPDWGMAHFNLAMSLWNLRQYAPALMHARHAANLGVPEADKVARDLALNLELGKPQVIDVYRRKP